MTAPACEVHPVGYRHHPESACALEWHHLMPREWGRSLLAIGDPTRWAPAVTPPPNVEIVQDPVYGPVWEPAGIWATRTCHGNVHAGIVELVHAWQRGDTIQSAIANAKRVKTGPRLDVATWSAAGQAIALWLGHGQTVEFLQAHRLWGQL